jgi:hypothetical protein
VSKTKVCGICKVKKSIEEFDRDSRSKDGLYYKCKKCKREYRLKSYHAKNPNSEYQKEYNEKPGFKICRKCGVEKSIEEFWKRSRNRDGLNCWCKGCDRESSKKYKDEHKEEISVYNKLYIENNREKISKIKKDYNKKNEEELKIKRKIYEEENKEKISNRQKIYNKEYQKTHMKDIIARTIKWSKTPKGRAAYSRAAHKKRSISEDVLNTLTDIEWMKVILDQNFKCNHCGRTFGEDLIPTKDHILPSSRGGGLTADNVQALCLSCNSRKLNRTEDELLEYLESRSLYDIIKYIHSREVEIKYIIPDVVIGKSIYSFNDNIYNNRVILGGLINMTEIVGQEVIKREKGFLYCIKSDGYVWQIPAKSNKTGIQKKVGTEQIKKEPGYLYYLGKENRVGRTPMKNAPKKA